MSSNRRTKRTRKLGWTCTAAAGMALSGCAQFWDDATAVSPEGGFRNNMAFRWHLLTTRQEPLVVLRDSTDGDMRARAYRSLKEPKNEKDRDFLLELLGTAAKTEKPTVCRLAAAETLGTFKDRRASEALMEAYRDPINANDANSVVRTEIVKSLAKTGHPDAALVLAEAVAKDPSRDVRLAAAQSLGKFQNYQATQALVQVLKDEKDVALRDQARLSLKQITGKNLPAKAEAWEVVFQPAHSGTLDFAGDQGDSAIQRASTSP